MSLIDWNTYQGPPAGFDPVKAAQDAQTKSPWVQPGNTQMWNQSQGRDPNTPPPAQIPNPWTWPTQPQQPYVPYHTEIGADGLKRGVGGPPAPQMPPGFHMPAPSMPTVYSDPVFNQWYEQQKAAGRSFEDISRQMMAQDGVPGYSWTAPPGYSGGPVPHGAPPGIPSDFWNQMQHNRNVVPPQRTHQQVPGVFQGLLRGLSPEVLQQFMGRPQPTSFFDRIAQALTPQNLAMLRQQYQPADRSLIARALMGQ